MSLYASSQLRFCDTGPKLMCPSPAIDLILAVDVSFSMSDDLVACSSRDRYKEAVISVLKTLITTTFGANALSENGMRVALVSFASTARVDSVFTFERRDLFSAVESELFGPSRLSGATR